LLFRRRSGKEFDHAQPFQQQLRPRAQCQQFGGIANSQGFPVTSHRSPDVPNAQPRHLDQPDRSAIESRQSMQLLTIPIALTATMVTYIVSYQVLREFTSLESPGLVAAVVALLTGLGLISLGDGVVTLILIPYAALGLWLLLLPGLKWLARGEVWRALERLLAAMHHFAKKFPRRCTPNLSASPDTASEVGNTRPTSTNMRRNNCPRHG
jgi:hypothetical protein